jgi:hypothetical protein
MNIVILICAIYGLAFAIKETDGPWSLISRWRNWMMRLPLVGVQFYKLLDCYYCLGFHCGWIVYLMSAESYKLGWALCWGLSGGTACLILNAILTRLYRE